MKHPSGMFTSSSLSGFRRIIKEKEGRKAKKSMPGAAIDEEKVSRVCNEVWAKVVAALKSTHDPSVAHEEAKMLAFSCVCNVAHTDAQNRGFLSKVYKVFDDKLQIWVREDLQERLDALRQPGEPEGTAAWLQKATKIVDFRIAIKDTIYIFRDLIHAIDKYSFNEKEFFIRHYYIDAYIPVYNKVKPQLFAVVHRSINRRREGKAVDMSGLRDAVEVFTDVGVALANDPTLNEDDAYHCGFESEYLARGVKYYSSPAALRGGGPSHIRRLCQCTA